MGKLLRQQRRGKGSPRYRVPSHNYIGKISYAKLPQGEGQVIDIVHSPGRRTPAAIVDFNGQKKLLLPAEGVFVGQTIGATADNGNIMKLRNLQEGAKIFNIELNPGDGGKLCRASGAFATIISKATDKCTILMPSREKKVISLDCMATIGVTASSGRTEKPWMKAGARHHSMKALGKLYPRTSGVSMNAVDHPFGGSKHPGRPKTVSRHMPPGKKVGSISPRRTGRKKK